LKTVKLALDSIRLDGGTQHRAETDATLIDEYAQSLLDGDVLPPVLVYRDPDDQNWLAGGFHRWKAHKEAARTKPEFAKIRAEVREGTLREAMLASFSENKTHGQRRTNADKRRILRKILEDEEWSAWSDRSISDRAKVSPALVAELRDELSIHKNKQIETRKVQRGGQLYTMAVGGIGRRAAGRQAETPTVRPGVREREERDRSVIIAEALSAIDTAQRALPEPQAVAAVEHFDVGRAQFIAMWWTKFAAHRRQSIERAS
jgi:uncharacterized ParB-like nuclease family protein